MVHVDARAVGTAAEAGDRVAADDWLVRSERRGAGTDPNAELRGRDPGDCVPLHDDGRGHAEIHPLVLRDGVASAIDIASGYAGEIEAVPARPEERVPLDDVAAAIVDVHPRESV